MAAIRSVRSSSLSIVGGPTSRAAWNSSIRLPRSSIARRRAAGASVRAILARSRKTSSAVNGSAFPGCSASRAAPASAMRFNLLLKVLPASHRYTDAVATAAAVEGALQRRNDPKDEPAIQAFRSAGTSASCAGLRGERAPSTLLIVTLLDDHPMAAGRRLWPDGRCMGAV